MKEELSADSLMRFYEDKAKENGGGQFYKVYHNGRKLRTEWGRNIWELKNFLRKQDIKFDHVVNLVG